MEQFQLMFTGFFNNSILEGTKIPHWTAEKSNSSRDNHRHLSISCARGESPTRPVPIGGDDPAASPGAYMGRA